MLGYRVSRMPAVGTVVINGFHIMVLVALIEQRMDSVDVRILYYSNR